jgi:hypothetical protein
VVWVRSRGFGDRWVVRGTADGVEVVDARAVTEGFGRAEGDAAGAAEGEDATQTSPIVSDGGRGCVVPASPVPQTHPFRSPSRTVVDAAPVEDHVHPPCPSPRQYPQKSG